MAQPHPIIITYPLLSFYQQLTVHRFLPFAIMACLALAAAIVCMTLPETHNQPTRESLSPDPKDQTNDENRNTKDGEVETPM